MDGGEGVEGERVESAARLGRCAAPQEGQPHRGAAQPGRERRLVQHVRATVAIVAATVAASVAATVAAESSKRWLQCLAQQSHQRLEACNRHLGLSR